MADLIDIDYDNITSEEAERILREHGYDPGLVGKYYALVAENTILRVERDAALASVAISETTIANLRAKCDTLFEQRNSWYDDCVTARRERDAALQGLRNDAVRMLEALERERVLQTEVGYWRQRALEAQP